MSRRDFDEPIVLTPAQVRALFVGPWAGTGYSLVNENLTILDIAEEPGQKPYSTGDRPPQWLLIGRDPDDTSGVWMDPTGCVWYGPTGGKSESEHMERLKTGEAEGEHDKPVEVMWPRPSDSIYENENRDGIIVSVGKPPFPEPQD